MARRFFTAAIALVAALALSACGPTNTAPTPSPESTEASVELAVREAKQAVINYVNALSAVRTDDQATLDYLYSLVIEDQLANERELYDQLVEKSWTIDGSMKITLIEVARDTTTPERTVASICLDVSGYHFFDETGTERVPPREDDVQSIDVHLVKIDEEWLIENLGHRAGEPRCP